MPVPEIQPIDNRIPIVRAIPPSVISAIEPPVVSTLPPPVSRSLQPPVLYIPDYSLQFPVIEVPTEAEYNAAVQAQRDKEQAAKEKSRSLPDSKPIVEVPPTQELPKVNVGGLEVELPEPSLIATAATFAVASTAATMASTIGFNVAKKSLGPAVKNAVKGKFKVKVKQTKPVLHYITAEDGHIDIFEYSDTGTRLVDQVEDVERYIRDKIDIDPLYEINNKVIIDDSMIDNFSREGKERFKPLFSPPKKIAKRLGAKLSLF
jgi:hypothetical protein